MQGMASPLTIRPAATCSVFEAADLRKSYGSGVVLDDVSLSLQPGAIMGLVGPNGAGKTTLLSILAGIAPPDSGTLRLDGRQIDFDRHPEERRVFGLMLGGRLLVPELTPREYWEFVRAMYGVARAAAEEDVAVLVDELRLREQLAKPIRDLSAGTQKKVEFIAALLHRPRLLLLDEPFEAIDPPAVADLTRVTKAYVRETGAAAIVSSHIIPYVRPLATEVQLLWSGRLVRPDELANRFRAHQDDIELIRWESVLSGLSA